MKKNAPPGTQAVRRAITLLKAFTPERPEREAVELALETGLSRSTVHRLLAALESEGFVVRDPTHGRFRLGPTAVTLGARAFRSSPLREAAHPLLTEIAELTGETTTLEVLSDAKMLILDEALSGRLVGASPSLGTAWALHATSTGKALLAALPRDRRQELLVLPLKRFTSRTLTSIEGLEDELERVRKCGYAEARDELEDGYSAVGTVIRVPMIEPHATLSIGGPTARIEPRLAELGELLKSRAGELSESLGFEH
jgi:IclR family acetate operon transcriptional repressor